VRVVIGSGMPRNHRVAESGLVEPTMTGLAPAHA